MKKKGLNQIDWAISLAIFLLYLAWFFVFLKPQIVKTADLSPLFSIIEQNLENELTWSVEKYPLFVRSSAIRNAMPVFIDFEPVYGANNFDFVGDIDYFYSEGKLFLLQDFNNDTSIYFIVQSQKNYSHTNSNYDIEKNGDRITTSKNFSAIFQNSLLKNVSYQGEDYVLNTEFSIKSTPLPTTNTSSQNRGVLYEYYVYTQPLSLYARMIAKNSVLWFFIDRNDVDEEKDFVVEMDLYDFDDFFSDNKYEGGLNVDNCEEYENDYLKFYNSKDSVSFFLPDNTSIEFCTNTTHTRLELSIIVDSDKDFYIVFDDAVFKEDNFTNYFAIKGLRKEIEGVDLSIFDNYIYEDKKEGWGYPVQRSFEINIWNKSLNNLNTLNPLFSLGSVPLINDDVYVKEYRLFELDKYAGLNEVTVGVKTW